MKLLRNQEFQNLLVDYPRAKRPFWVSYQPDDVAAERMPRFGKYGRTEDYLEAFSQFVKENGDKVDALSILLKRSRDWRPKALEELRRSLAQNYFDERKLQEVHKLAGQQADVISIVKHSAAHSRLSSVPFAGSFSEAQSIAKNVRSIKETRSVCRGRRNAP
jgi:type I restriction enzyme, R subunit